MILTVVTSDYKFLNQLKSIAEDYLIDFNHFDRTYRADRFKAKRAKAPYGAYLEPFVSVKGDDIDQGFWTEDSSCTLDNIKIFLNQNCEHKSN